MNTLVPSTLSGLMVSESTCDITDVLVPSLSNMDGRLSVI
jgi:hypothetical protein